MFTSPDEYLLDRGLGLVAKGTDCDTYTLCVCKVNSSNHYEIHSLPIKYWEGGWGVNNQGFQLSIQGIMTQTVLACRSQCMIISRR